MALNCWKCLNMPRKRLKLHRYWLSITENSWENCIGWRLSETAHKCPKIGLTWLRLNLIGCNGLELSEMAESWTKIGLTWPK